MRTRRSIDTHVDIDAPVQAVWEAVTDLDRYRDWNPFIIDASGRIEAGARLHLRMQRPMKTEEETHTPTVTALHEGRLLQWSGIIKHPAFFRARHSFVLEERDGGVRLRQLEEFGGLSMPLAGAMVWRIEQGFMLMNAALKVRAESLVAAS
ncbi:MULTISPECIES: SRPBCC domain-containing protein [unclassified Streptomyces]|uniref:SRPBCC domain-containing protein n=1 Tax=unclassified Streptomyces TaxID=2593676 RepID=UPI002254E5FA|nr:MULTISPECIES: SRPBCC domain-containing protein [unclassified Streptomyces]MCX4834917.1 SRPBCC domain-containing protein [Streptomyces sp. NBC_01016]